MWKFVDHTELHTNTHTHTRARALGLLRTRDQHLCSAASYTIHIKYKK